MKKKHLKNEIQNLKNQIIDFENTETFIKSKYDKKDAELQETLKVFEEIRDELTYFKGFHDGVKNGAKVNFSPTINQPSKKEYASGGIINDDRCENQKRDEREFCKPMEPRPETVEKVLSFSERMKNFDENVHKCKTDNLNKESETSKSGLLKFIFESFIGSDAKGLVICKGEPSSEVLEEIKTAIDEVSQSNDEGTKRGDGTTACNPK